MIDTRSTGSPCKILKRYFSKLYFGRKLCQWTSFYHVLPTQVPITLHVPLFYTGCNNYIGPIHQTEKFPMKNFNWYAKTEMAQCLCFKMPFQYIIWTLSHPEALHWRVKSSDVRQSTITKGTVLAGLGEERLIHVDQVIITWYSKFISFALPGMIGSHFP